MCLHSIQTHAGGVAVVSWHFPRGLHFIIENVSYTQTHTCRFVACALQLTSVFWICEALKWLSQVVWPLIAPDKMGGEVGPKKNTLILHSSRKWRGFWQMRRDLCMWGASGHRQTFHSHAKWSQVQTLSKNHRERERRQTDRYIYSDKYSVAQRVYFLKAFHHLKLPSYLFVYVSFLYRFID